MKLLHNNHYIKLIPEKFGELENVADFIEEEHKKRLTQKERSSLTSALFEQRVTRFLVNGIEKNEPLVFEQIQQAKPVKTYKVTTNDHQVYYLVEFDNKVKVRCSEFLHRISPEQGKLKYASCLSSTKIPPPGEEQLELFPPIP